MKVIGLTGTIGAGKYMARDFLEKKFGVASVRLSDVIDVSALKKRKVKITRQVLQNRGDEVRQQYGTHALAKIATDVMKPTEKIKVIDGIRNPGEVEYFKSRFGDDFLLIAIDAPQQIRFERTVKRNRDIDSKAWEEFVADDERDQGKDQPPYGQQVRKCIEMADIVIQNDGNLEEFHKKIEDATKEL